MAGSPPTLEAAHPPTTETLLVNPRARRWCQGSIIGSDPHTGNVPIHAPDPIPTAASGQQLQGGQAESPLSVPFLPPAGSSCMCSQVWVNHWVACPTYMPPTHRPPFQSTDSHVCHSKPQDPLPKIQVAPNCCPRTPTTHPGNRPQEHKKRDSSGC